eukprot:6056963-Alexandrium_andersonii.AAC.1
MVSTTSSLRAELGPALQQKQAIRTRKSNCTPALSQARSQRKDGGSSNYSPGDDSSDSRPGIRAAPE